jgi:metaxin
MPDFLTVPPPLRTFFAYFPLYTYPLSPPFPTTAVPRPTIWIHPPRRPQDSPLSGDIECLKWQAYLALHGLTSISVRWDVAPDGCIDGQLPNLHTPEKDGGQLLAAHGIPSWTESHVGEEDSLHGYRDQLAKDESSAWVSVLESKIYPALVGHPSASEDCLGLISFRRSYISQSRRSFHQ